MITIGEWWMWVSFSLFILLMIFIDLVLLGGKKAHVVSTREALGWSIIWFVLALLFNLGLWFYLNYTATPEIANARAIEFFTGYLIEKSLAVDNIFVFLMIFSFFAIPSHYQHRVLIYGVLGAIIMRMIFILIGIRLISQFYWVLYVFGIFLIATGIKMFIFAKEKPNLKNNIIISWIRNNLRTTEKLHGDNFFIKYNNKLYVTPLFAALLLIEFSDLVFAVDSIPAIFAITNDPFIVYTSNIFAILGLRALYFIIAPMHNRFKYLKHGLSIILMFIGFKMLLSNWIKISPYLALGVIISILALSVILSLSKANKQSHF